MTSTLNSRLLARPARSSTLTVTGWALTWARVGVQRSSPEAASTVMPGGPWSSDQDRPAWFSGLEVSMSISSSVSAATAWSSTGTNWGTLPVPSKLLTYRISPSPAMTLETARTASSTTSVFVDLKLMLSVLPLSTAERNGQRVGHAEQVARAVGVAGHQVGGIGFKRNPVAVTRNRGIGAVAVCRLIRRATDQGGRAAGAVVNENVGPVVVISGHEVGSQRAERDEAPVVGNRGLHTVVIALGTSARNAHALRRAGTAVAHEDVPARIAVGRDEVGCLRSERDEVSVAGDMGVAAFVIAEFAVAVGADQFGRPGVAVADEHIGLFVDVAGYEIVGQRIECHPASGVRQAPGNAVPATLVAERIAADPLQRRRRLRFDIQHEHVVRLVVVVGERTYRRGMGIGKGMRRMKGDEPAVAGQRGLKAGSKCRRRVAARVARQQVGHGQRLGVEIDDRRDRYDGGGGAGEDDPGAIAGNAGKTVVAHRLAAVGLQADAPGGAGAEVAHEDVALAVGVAGDEIAGVRPERKHGPIVGKRGLVAVRVGLAAVAGQADALDLGTE